jgi:phosphatidylethanolamine-binding protein (PEBP) family uncharacterized protein
VLVLVAAVVVALVLADLLTAEVRYRQCRDDRAGSPTADLVTCRRALLDETRRGGIVASLPTPQAPSGPRISVESPAFPYAGSIPTEYSCDGRNTSPSLRWWRVPKGAVAQAIVVVDNDYSRPGVVRWSLLNLSPNVRRLGRGAHPAGAIETENSLGRRAYDGPCVRKNQAGGIGVTFLVYALDRRLRLTPEASIDQVFAAINEAVTAQGSLSAGYDPPTG